MGCVIYTHMAKQRIQVSIHPDLVAVAESMMGEQSYVSFSAYLETLIRAEKDRRDVARAAAGGPAAVPLPARKPRKRRLKSRPVVPPQVALEKLLPPDAAAANA
jgi:hypothetical protein